MNKSFITESLYYITLQNPDIFQENSYISKLVKHNLETKRGDDGRCSDKGVVL